MKLDRHTLINWTTGFFILTALLIIKFGYHEMWKDEWQAWFLSRDLGVIELLDFLYYEGHPALWYLFLKPFALLWPDGDLGLKLAHSVLLIATFFVFFRMKVPIYLKGLIVLSYAVGFEYAIVSRGYILVVLLGLLAVERIKADRASGWLMAVILFLLCQTEVHGVLLTGALFLVLIAQRKNFGDLKWPGFGLISGVLFFLISVYPRKSGDELSFAYSSGFFEWENWMVAFQGLSSNAMLPGIIEDTSLHGWSVINMILGLIVLVGVYFLFRKSKKSLILFFSFWLAAFLFHSMIYSGGLRQWSMVAYVFMAALLLKQETEKQKIGIYLSIALLIPGVIYGLKANYKDITMPFTNAQKVGWFIAEKVPENVPIVAINKFECSPVGGYANRMLYSLPSGQTFSFFKWVEKVYLPSEEELRLFADFKGVEGFVIVAPYELEGKRYPTLRLWEKFDKMNLKNERYYVYVIDK